MPRDYNNEVIPQARKPEEKVRLFHGSPGKITSGEVEARYVPYEDHGWEDTPGGFHAAFASEDIHDAARYAGPEGHIYEVHNPGRDTLEGDRGYWNTSAGFKIKQEVGHPGRNIMRTQHFSMGHNESRK
jgi:hypothetical protein